MANESFVTEFQLLEFTDILELHLLFFVSFLLVYLTAIIGNLLIITVVALNNHLQNPMYFFLANLSVIDLGYISATIFKAMMNSLEETTNISYSECVAQTFFLLLFGGSELFLLTIMAYDRYIAVCNPLNYVNKMNRGRCMKLAASAWIFGLFDATLNTACTFSISFCSNSINQLFCEIPQLLRLSCSSAPYLTEFYVLFFTVLVCMTCFCFTIISYVLIFKAVFSIPTTQGKKKVFATCLPHLTVLSLFYVTGIYAYLGLVFTSHSGLDVIISLSYSVVPPFINPLIYSFRNKDIIDAFVKFFKQICRF